MTSIGPTNNRMVSTPAKYTPTITPVPKCIVFQRGNTHEYT